MVEKIDRPEAPQPYQIMRPKDAKEDQHRPPSQREEQEKRYQKQLAEKEWSKFDKRTMTIRPLKTARDEVQRCLFRSVTSKSGIGVLQVDVFWVNGRMTTGALVLLAHLEDFMKLKKFKPGQEVPQEFWARGTTVEFGIIEVSAENKLPPLPTDDKPKAPTQPTAPHWLSAIGLTGREGRGINWGVAVLYIFLAAIAVMVLISALR